MTIKNDLKDIGYYLITPYPNRFEGVNYKRATRQLTVGTLALQLTLVAGCVVGPVILEGAVTLKNKMFKKTPKK